MNNDVGKIIIGWKNNHNKGGKEHKYFRPTPNITLRDLKLFYQLKMCNVMYDKKTIKRIKRPE